MSTKSIPTPSDTSAASSSVPASELERLQVLYNISDILTKTQRSDRILAQILTEAVRAVRATSGSLILLDHDTGLLNIEIAYNLSPSAEDLKLRIGEGVTGTVAETGKPLCIGDVRKSEHYVTVKAEVRSELAVPLSVNNRVIGVINVDSNEVDAFSDADVELLTAVAAQSARVMQTARLYEDDRLKAKRLETLFNIAGAVVSEPLLDDVLRRVVGEVRRLLDVKVCSIVLLDETEMYFEIRAVSGEVGAEYSDRTQVPVEGTIVGEVLQRRKHLYTPDVREEKRYRLTAVARDSGLCSMLAVPVLYLGKAIGVMNLYSGERRVFPPEEIALLNAFAGHTAIAIINAQRYQRIFHTEESLRMAEKFSLLGTLAAEIAHEIRNPVTVLQMLLHSVQEDEGLSDDSRSDLEVMSERLVHINGIVDQVLDFSKPRTKEHWREVSVNQILEDVYVLLGHKAASMNLSIRQRLADSLPPVLVNPGQIEQAVLNLALNALDAMADQGEVLNLSTGMKSLNNEDRVYIRVTDEGCGLPSEKLEQIFSPYFSMRNGGTGLGLFITRKIITEHGGQLEVSSRLGKGSTFEIILPVAE